MFDDSTRVPARGMDICIIDVQRGRRGWWWGGGKPMYQTGLTLDHLAVYSGTRLSTVFRLLSIAVTAAMVVILSMLLPTFLL